MLRVIQNSASESAKRYYTTADYYAEGQEPMALTFAIPLDSSQDVGVLSVIGE